MKKRFLIPCLLIVGLSTAQLQKGNFMIGPSFNIQNYKSQTQPVDVASAGNKSNNQTNINLTLGVGYFAADNILLGVYYQNASSRRVIDSYSGSPGIVSQYKANDIIHFVGLFGRSYKTINDKIGFFGNIDAAYQFGKGKLVNEKKNPFGTTITESNSDVTGFYAGVRPGIVYFIKDRVGLEASFGVLSFNSTTRQNYVSGVKTDQVNNDSFNIDFGATSFNFGLNFYFGSKKE